MRPNDKNSQKNPKNNPQIASYFMPKGMEAQKVLRERAAQFAKHEMEQTEESHAVIYVRFRLNTNEHYGIPYQYAKEIMHNITLTKLPSTPHFIAGVINRRGALIAVLDLKKLFNIATSEYSKDPYFIIITGNGITLGILADNIEGSDMYDPATLNTPLSLESVINPEYITGLHNGITAIINVEKIIADCQQYVKKMLHE